MQKGEIEVSKRELGRYAPKMTKTGRSPENSGDLVAPILAKLAESRDNEKLVVASFKTKLYS